MNPARVFKRGPHPGPAVDGSGERTFASPSIQVLGLPKRFVMGQVRMDHEKDSYEQQNV